MSTARVGRHLDDLWHYLARIDDIAIPAVERDERGGDTAVDGYPTRSIGDGSHGTGENTATEANALAGYQLICDAPDCGRKIPCSEHAADVDQGAVGEWTERRDLVHEYVTEIENELATAARHLRQAHKQALKARHLQNTDRRHSNPPTDCLACTRTVACTTADPISAGHCKQCSYAWLRFKKAEIAEGRTPDVIKFRKQRAEWFAKKHGETDLDADTDAAVELEEAVSA